MRTIFRRRVGIFLVLVRNEGKVLRLYKTTTYATLPNGPI
ncbi:hypothetical protein CPT_Mansfield_008 [Escherichia phage Mansfield]|uniref:Uncharacterized protein n=1 Tax=Escherichia phage Mansfield TaxID=2591099 RepID=A0A5B9NG70_9CAUD|nr:hypothetical protein CPT_Mansfield_008 [Escherichia phage Mansfield]